jgi:hypothetical protein
MPLIKPKFVPGVVKDDSKLAAEGSWTDSDKMRFVGGKPQVIGGWEELSLSLNPSTPFDSGVFDSNVFDSVFVSSEEIYPGQVRGAHTWADNDGATYLAWGTSAGLFVMHTGIVYDITPAEFVPETSASSLPYGMGPYGSGPFGSGSRVIWSLDNWGENLLASPRGGSLYEWAPHDTKATIIATAPTPITSFFVSPERIVVLLGTQEFGGSIFNPMLVRWSDQGNNAQWTPSPANLAGEFPLSFGSKLIAGLAARGLNMVWSDSAVYTMSFTGSVSSVYTIKPAGFGCGLIGPHAACATDSSIVWGSRNNFWIFNGQSASILPCTLRQDVFENLYPNNEEKMHAAWNTGYGEAWFFYPDTRDGTGECSRYAMLNSQGQWAAGSFDRTAWVKASVFPFPIAFSANTHKIYYQEVPNAGDAGGPLSAFVESGFIDVGDGDTLYIIKRIVPDFLNSLGPTVNISLKTKLWPNDIESTHGPYAAMPTTTKLDLRVKAREMAVRFESAGASDNSFWKLGAIGFESQQSGEKR